MQKQKVKLSQIYINIYSEQSEEECQNQITAFSRSLGTEQMTNEKPTL